MSAGFDRRRIQAPEVSYAPTYTTEHSKAGPSRRIDREKDEARPICAYHIAVSAVLGLTPSPQDWSHQSSEWKRLYRSRGREDCMLGVSDRLGLRINVAHSRYGPRPKQPPYSPQGSLNLEIKFAPFASHPRRAPLRVRTTGHRRRRS